MDEFSGEALFVIAAVVIAFINWLSNTLKQKAAQREAERRRARGEFVPEEERVVVVEDDSWPSLEEEDVAPAQRRAPVDANQEIRDFFEALTGTPAAQPQVVHEPPPVPQRQAPPPEPEPPSWSAPKVSRPSLSAAERAALERIEGHEMGVTRRSRRGSYRGGSVVELLREPGGARQGIVLAEILGKPKALAEGDAIR